MADQLVRTVHVDLSEEIIHKFDSVENNEEHFMSKVTM